MIGSRKGSQILAAQRTGVHVAYDEEVNDQIENTRGAWAVMFAMALAFALILQMDSEKSRGASEEIVSSRMATALKAD